MKGGYLVTFQFNDILEDLMINQERLVNAFLEYVQISSPTKKEGEFARHITKILTEIGFEVTVDDAGEKLGCDTGNDSSVAWLATNIRREPWVTALLTISVVTAGSRTVDWLVV